MAQNVSTLKQNIIVCFFTRGRKNGDWILSCNSSRFMFKNRKIVCQVPATTNGLLVEFLITPIGPKSGPDCFYISRKQTTDKEEITNSPQTLKIACEPKQHTETTVFLKRHTDKLQKLVEYKFTIQITLPGATESIVIHEYNFCPETSHKFESSPKGKIANATNATEITASLPQEILYNEEFSDCDDLLSSHDDCLDKSSDNEVQLDYLNTSCTTQTNLAIVSQPDEWTFDDGFLQNLLEVDSFANDFSAFFPATCLV